MKTYVAYYRVSTNWQEKSGLGIEGQIADVKRFIGYDELIAEFTEIESGGNNKRPRLEEAISLCKKKGAILVIARLDRLSRDVMFIEGLKRQGIRFVCCDMPDANELVIGIMAQMAQYERNLISERIKKSLQAKKARGDKWGGATPEHCAKMREKRGCVKIDPAIKYVVEAELAKGLSLSKIAKVLNDLGHRTFEGKDFTGVQVMRLRDRINLKQVV